ncbi:MAG: MaoC family dehydratase [Patescibacteria group bacterium]
MPNSIPELRFEDCVQGMQAEFSVTITEELVRAFAELSGDQNPIHVDETYAEQTPFHGRIAHGMIASALFSRLIGMHLPGLFSLYLSQQLNFRKPMHIGDEVIVRGTITQKTESMQVIRIRTELIHQGTLETLVDGEAMVKMRVDKSISR